MLGLHAGAHLCVIYEDLAEQLAAFVPFMKAGLDGGERCLYIVDESTASEVEVALRDGGLDVDRALADGSLIVTDKRETYLRAGYFDPDAMIAFLDDQTSRALADGYSALRVTGEMTWMMGGEPGTERLMEYEAKLNLFLASSSALAACQYHRQRFTPAVIRQVIETHPLVVFGGLVCDNEHFVPPEEFLEPDQTGREVERLLNGLVERATLSQALRESEHRYRRLVEAATEGIWVTDPDGFLTFVNPAMATMLGHPPAEMVGRPMASFVGEASRADFRDRVDGGAEGRYDLELVHRDGTAVWALVGTVPLEDEHRPGSGTLGIVSDITARRKAEEALQEREARFRSLVRHAADAIVLLDADDRIVWASPAITPMMGYSPEWVVGRRGLDFVHPADADRLAEVWERALVASAPQVPEAFRLRAHDGGWHWIEETVTNLLDEPAVGAVVLNMRDVTARHEAGIALRESEGRFRRLADNAQDGVYRLRLVPEPAFEYVNPALSALSGLTTEEIYGDPTLLLTSVFHPDHEGGLGEVIRRAQGDVDAPVSAHWLRTDGNDVWVEERHSIVRDDAGRAVAVEGIVRDVSARIENEQALRAALERERDASERLRAVDAMKDSILSAISHELRTPLTALQGFSEFLADKWRELPDDRIDTMLERLARNGKRLADLLTDLLDVDRLSRGGALEPKLETVDVASLVLGVLESIELRGREITTRIEPTPAHVDIAKVERIVDNLVANALRHTTPETPIWVGLDSDEDEIHLVVEDAGPGVPEDLRTAIFEPFRTGPTDAAKVGGTGIGLSIVARFTELHGGRAWVEDRPGGGASFHVRLPRGGGTQ